MTLDILPDPPAHTLLTELIILILREYQLIKVGCLVAGDLNLADVEDVLGLEDGELGVLLFLLLEVGGEDLVGVANYE